MQVDSRLGTKTTAGLAIKGGTPVRNTWLPYGRQSISDDDIAAVVNVLRSDWLTQGPNIAEFEKSVANACGVKHAVAVSNGTAALHAAYYAAGIEPGDNIVTSGMTFAATANAALYLGATPQFADVDPQTGNICPKSAAKLINKNTKAIVGIDYSGHPCDIDELQALADQAGVMFIVDGAHSLGATYKGKPTGGLASMTTFSFHPVKTVTTGEGGMILTNDPKLAHKLQLFRTHGIEKDPQHLSKVEGPWYHEQQYLGFNYRLCDIQAALGTSQMKRLQQFVQRRREIAARYRQHLSNSKCFSPTIEKPFVESAYHLFPVLVNEQHLDRKTAVEALHAENIGVQVHYIPTYQHPYYQQQFGDIWSAQCPNTNNFYNRQFGLPMFPGMSDADIDDVLKALDKLEQAFG